MATDTETVTIATNIGTYITKVTELDNTYATLRGAADTMYFVHVDNTKNTGEAVYVKFYDSATPTVGTTAPIMIIPCAPGKEFFIGKPVGWAFGTAITAACVTTGGTGGTTAPSNGVDVICYI